MLLAWNKRDVLHFAYQITWRHSLETLSKGKSWWEVGTKNVIMHQLKT